jgi:UPF0271 protein
MPNFDLNCDMGEIPEAIADGSQEALMPYLTAVNIACGGHAGDDETMRTTIAQARRWNLAIGAHPGYPDRANFGRLPVEMPLEAVSQMVFEQVSGFARIANSEVRHVKPHGALYNSAVTDRPLARAIAHGVARWNKNVILMALAGSAMLQEFREAGFPVMAEAFADRRYEANGTLRSRRFPDALITDPEEAAEQVQGILHRGAAGTICIHGDNPAALAIAKRLAAL